MQRYRTGLAAASTLLTACAAVASDRPELQLAGKRATDRTVVLSADVACSPARSYELWSTERGVTSFYAPAARIDASVGGAYTVMFFPEDDPEGLSYGTAGARVLAADPGRFLAFEWVVFAADAARGPQAPPQAPPSLRMPDPLPTWVELHFAPQGTGTHVEFRHYGFGDGELWGQSHAWFERAWSMVLTQMEAACGSPT